MPLKDVALKQPADQRIPTGKFIVRPFPPDAPNSLVRNVRDNHTVQAAPEAANRTRQKPYDCLWHKIKPDTVLSVLKTTETSGGTEESGFPGCGGHHMPPLFFCDTKNSTPPPPHFLFRTKTAGFRCVPFHQRNVLKCITLA